MKKKRLIAAVMAFVVLMPMLMSCSSEKKGRKTVKEDDPWYESNTFKLELDVRKDEYDTPQEYLSDWVNRERVDCYYDQINDYLDFVHACCSQNGRYVIIGTPSVDASGPRFKALETVSVSATTDIKDGCKKFINYLFSGAAYISSECEFLNIVTNREIMNRNIDILTRRNNDYFDRYEAAKKSGAIMVPYYVDKTLGDRSLDDVIKYLNDRTTKYIREM